MLLSIQLNTNRPKEIKDFVNNVEETSSNPSDIEILVNIDTTDDACKNTLENLQTITKLKLRFIQTDIIKGYKDLWKPLNVLLEHTDPTVYFVTNFSDEFRFKTKGWDDILKKYIGYYEDDIFRIRLSRYRFRNYFDFWECIYAPDSLAFYTKKWMDTVKIWCPCLGPDSWQQLVAFYLINSRKFDHIQYDRDISENFIMFEGEGASLGLTGLKAKQRIKDNVDLWFETVSYEMQEKAKYAAAMLQTGIIMHKNSDQKKISRNFISNRKPPAFDGKNISQVSFRNNKNRKRVEFFYENKPIYKINYGLNKLKLFFVNNIRKLNYGYYAGGGQECFRKDLISQINVYLRMRKYGSFDSKNKTIKKPNFLKKNKLNFLWTPIKIILLVTIIIKNLFFKLTKTEKYFRLLSFKFIKFKRFLIRVFRLEKINFYIKKYRKPDFFKKNKIGFLWIPFKLVIVLSDMTKTIIRNSKTKIN